MAEKQTPDKSKSTLAAFKKAWKYLKWPFRVIRIGWYLFNLPEYIELALDWFFDDGSGPLDHYSEVVYA